MVIRKLLILKDPTDDPIEKALKRMYLKRIQEMFKKVLNLESVFNIFDEIFHGLSSVSFLNEDLYSFYESLLTITSYYQHSQAGRGSLVARLLKDLGNSEKIEFEFPLVRLSEFLEREEKLKESELPNIKFDIVNKSNENLIFCELKMKVYSGCTAGRIELMEKFNKFVKLIISNQKFRKLIKSTGIKNIFLIGGILFDIQGEPATKERDKEWGICYNGLLRGKEEIIKTLKENNQGYKVNNENLSERDFLIEFIIDEIKVNIIAVYGNEVIKTLFAGRQRHNIEYFKKLLEEKLFDDMWLAHLITISERAILEQNFKKNRKLNNYIITILKNKEILSEIENFSSNKSIEMLKKIVAQIISVIEKDDKNLLDLTPPAITIINSLRENYQIEDYLADIVQFLSCKEVRDFLINNLPE